MESGNVAAILFAQARARSRVEWERGLDAIWPEVLRELRSNPGFKGLLALWKEDDSGQVSIIGLWDTMEHRLAYERRSADSVRARFNALFQAVPDRPRFYVSRATLA